MLIVVIGYLYVVGIVGVVALASGHIASGIFTLLFAGLLPTWLWLSLLRRKRINHRALLQEQAEAQSATAPANSES